jgi:hypothetical protein
MRLMTLCLVLAGLLALGHGLRQHADHDSVRLAQAFSAR